MATTGPLPDDRILPIAQAAIAQARVVHEPRNLTLEVLRALAHPVRLELVAQIAARGPLCVCHLEPLLDCGQPQISKHIGVLRRAGIVESRRDGRWIHYSINEDALAAADEFFVDLRASMHRPHLPQNCSDEQAS